MATFGACALIGNIRYVDLDTHKNHLKRRPTKHGHLGIASHMNKLSS